ncbi:MAG: aldehyde dehydrogenase family protein, partial [Pseudomonadota bacterium]
MTLSSDTLGHHINGQHVMDDNRPAPVTNPATGQVTKHVALATKQTVEEAISAASAAFPAWRDLPPLKRARIMFKYKELLEKNADRIALTISQEHGKVVDDAMGEFIRGVEVVEYACAAPEILKGEHARNVGPKIDSWSEFQPLGVVAGITPFNFPAMVPMWMFPMAIVCGNTFVLKPSEKDPTTAIILAELLSEAGLPDGVFNVVNGDK